MILKLTYMCLKEENTVAGKLGLLDPLGSMMFPFQSMNKTNNTNKSNKVSTQYMCTNIVV